MQIMVDAGIVAKIYAYISLCPVPAGQEALQKEILDWIEKKNDALQRRQTFTEYKRAAYGTAEREANRQKYLDSAGVLEGFRTSGEYPDCFSGKG